MSRRALKVWRDMDPDGKHCGECDMNYCNSPYPAWCHEFDEEILFDGDKLDHPSNWKPLRVKACLAAESPALKQAGQRRKLSDAGDRHDWDACDAIEGVYRDARAELPTVPERRISPPDRDSSGGHKL